MQTIANVLIAVADVATAIAPAGLESATILLAWGLTLHAPLLIGIALLVRLDR